jgi:hypothetical protein
MATTTMGPNNTSGVVWAIGVFFCLFFMFFLMFFPIMHVLTCNHVFRRSATCLNIPAMHFDIQTTHFDPHRPNEGHQRPTMANDGQQQPTTSNTGQTKTNEGPQTQGLRDELAMGPNNARHVVWALGAFSFFFYVFFLIHLPYYCHLPAPATCFDASATCSDLPAACFNPFQHPSAQTTRLASFGP